MAPSKTTAWDDEESESTPPSSPPAPAVMRRGKFDDEEDDSDVVEDWDAAEDSEVEREKEKKAAEAKAKAEAEAKANHKSKTQRIEEKREAARLRKEMEDLETEDSDEDEASKRARLRAAEKESDMANAEDLFGGVGAVPKSRGAAKAVTIQDENDPNNSIDLSALKLFSPATAPQFAKLRETLVPLLNANGKKPQYPIFLQQLTKDIVRDLSSEQVKKIASTLTTVSNEKMKEEKAAEKGGKKTKAAKTKTTLAANRDMSNKADLTAYDDDGLDEYDCLHVPHTLLRNRVLTFHSGDFM